MSEKISKDNKKYNNKKDKNINLNILVPYNNNDLWLILNNNMINIMLYEINNYLMINKLKKILLDINDWEYYLVMLLYNNYMNDIYESQIDYDNSDFVYYMLNEDFYNKTVKHVQNIKDIIDNNLKKFKNNKKYSIKFDSLYYFIKFYSSLKYKLLNEYLKNEEELDNETYLLYEKNDMYYNDDLNIY